MTGLTKAYLAEITSGASPTEVAGSKVDVQFNPTTLRIQISNRTAGGQQAGAQARQRPGTGEMQLGFDLVFDTADEGSTDDGVSVLEKTKAVERFVRPRGPRAGQEAPPRVVFVWGDFQVQGTMESANLDLDLFDANGVPLRAKVAVSIKGQDPRWSYTPAPPAPGGANAALPAGGAARPGSGTTLPPGAPGTQGIGLAPDRIVQAMPGESLAQLAARAGFDPSAWRALADGLANPLQLELGQEVPLPAHAGGGAANGNTGRDAAQLAAGLPLVEAAPAGGSRAAQTTGSSGRPAAVDAVRLGQALTSRGGLQPAIDAVRQSAHQHGADSSLAAFGLSSIAASEAVDRPWGSGIPLRQRLSLPTAARPARTAAGLASERPLQAARLARRGACSSGCGCQACRGGKR